MRRISITALIIAAAIFAVSAKAQSLDNALQIYAVFVLKTEPFGKDFTGYGVYLGKGYVITAAHVVGHYRYFTDPRVRIGTKTFPATVVKEGSFSTVDLALLSIDTADVPIALQLRRNPLCREPPHVGMQAIDVLPDKILQAHVINPLSIAQELQRRYQTLIDSPKESGSGLYDAERKCLMGIMSAKMPKLVFQLKAGSLVATQKGFAGYFVPARQIADFLPAGLIP